MDEAYCCIGCAGNGPCVCTYEADLADDGVDNLGHPFASPEVVSADDFVLQRSSGTREFERS
jgi:hypothetical protein